MGCRVIGYDCIARVAQSSLLLGNSERCGCTTWLEEASARKGRGHGVGTGNLIEREIARGRAGGVCDTCATLCADGECDCLGGHPRRGSAKGKYSRKSNIVVEVTSSSGSVGERGGRRGHHKRLEEIPDVGQTDSRREHCVKTSEHASVTVVVTILGSATSSLAGFPHGALSPVATKIAAYICGDAASACILGLNRAVLRVPGGTGRGRPQVALRVRGR